jgi:glycosyltransferase involved in cell wall biosynthesis
MKITLAIKSLNAVGGGAERVFVHVANALAARGHGVNVLTFDPPGSSFYPLDGRIGRVDLGLATPGQPTPRFSLLFSLRRIRSAIVLGRPDIAVGFMHSIYVPLAAALTGTGIPLLASEHAGKQHFETRAFERILVKVLSRRLAAKSVPSAVVQSQCLESDYCPVVVLPNPIDVRQFELGILRSPNVPPVLLSVGRFSAEKNQCDLLNAFSLLVGDFPEWTLRFAGDGEMRALLERRVAELGLANRVQMPGAVSAMAEEYAAASIVVMPSRWESFGLATVEALASARPVIGFADCPGTNELIRDGHNGLLVAGGEDRVRRLEAGLRRLMSDASLRRTLGSRGPASVSHFGGDAVTPVWEEFFLRHARAPG